MSRYIKADALIKFIDNRFDITWEHDYEGGIKDACMDILEEINKQPTADVVEVVRCKDCFKKESCRTFNTWAVPPSEDWFCADGERREDGKIH